MDAATGQDTPPPEAADEPRLQGFRANLHLDLVTAVFAFPSGRWLIPLIVVVIGAGFGLVRPGYHSVYSESLLAIVIFAVVGSFGRTLGTVLVIVYGIGDMIRFLLVPDNFGSHVDLHDIVGRVLANGVLWLVVVLVPSIGRRVEWTIQVRSGFSTASRYIGAAMGGATAAAGTYVWAYGMQYLQASLYRQSPLPATLQPEQHPAELAIAIGVVYVVVALLLRRRPVWDLEVGPIIGGLPRAGVRGFLVRLAIYAIAILGVSGILYNALDLGVLIASCIVAELGAWVVGRPAMTHAAGRTPAVLLYVAAAGLSAVAVFGVSRIALSAWPQGLGESLFWPIILAIAVGLPVGRITFTFAAHGRAASPSISRSASVAGTATLVVLALLAFPQVAFADNCGHGGSLLDCLYQAEWWVQTLTLALFTGGLSLLFTGLSGPQPPQQQKQINKDVPLWGQKRQLPMNRGPNQNYYNTKGLFNW